MEKKLDINSFDNDSLKKYLKEVNNISKAFELKSNIVAFSELTSIATVVQNAMTATNLNAVVSNVLRTQLEQIYQTDNITNQAALTVAKNAIPTFDNSFKNSQLITIKGISEAVKQSLNGYYTDYTKIFSQLEEVLRKLPIPDKYNEEEIEENISSIKNLAENGWVIYFQLENVYQRVQCGKVSELETEWVGLLEERLTDDKQIQMLQDSDCFAKHLVDSMIDSHKHKNYYAAYTLASLAIDGAINRVSEITSNGNYIPVGYKAVKNMKEDLFHENLNDLGLLKWLIEFFKDTNRFTLDKPNRHMIGHGRWDNNISKTDFLKLYNVMLYIQESFPYWKEITLSSTNYERKLIYD